jgi:hypothetical protein
MQRAWRHESETGGSSVQENQQAVDLEEGAKPHLEVTVHNEDDGETYELHVNPPETLAKAIERLYKNKLRLERQPDDRLRCESGGEDVFQFEELTFREYIAAGHCPELDWLFAGGTGGA